MTISPGALSTAFAANTNAYTASVGPQIDQLAILTTLSSTTATVAVNGNTSNVVALNYGDNVITVLITAQDGITTNTYTITAYRASPPDAVVGSNLLSPNGDGKNDAWVIKDILLYPNNTVTVYDRAGRAIFTKRGYTNDFNGTLKGAPLAEGTYYYTISLAPAYPLIKGFITILRSR